MANAVRNKLVVLHGWGHDKALWEDFAHRFPEGDVRVLDLPGFGEEPLVDGEWGIPEYAAWVKERLASIAAKEGDGNGGIVLLGHSFGGRIAAFVASERPAWLRALVLYAAPCLYRPTASVRAKIAAAKALKRLGFARPEAGRYAANAELREADAKGMGKIFRKTIVFDETEALRRIAVPTLLIWGGRDTYPTPAMGREMHALISGSTLRIMEQSGHNAHLENPILFYGIIRQFLHAL